MFIWSIGNSDFLLHPIIPRSSLYIWNASYCDLSSSLPCRSHRTAATTRPSVALIGYLNCRKPRGRSILFGCFPCILIVILRSSSEADFPATISSASTKSTWTQFGGGCVFHFSLEANTQKTRAKVIIVCHVANFVRLWTKQEGFLSFYCGWEKCSFGSKTFSIFSSYA